MKDRMKRPTLPVQQHQDTDTSGTSLSLAMDRMLDRHDPRLLEQLILEVVFMVSFLQSYFKARRAEAEILAG